MYRIVQLIAALGFLLLLAGCGSDEPDEVSLADNADPTEEPGDTDGDDEEPEAGGTEEPDDGSNDDDDASEDEPERIVEGGQAGTQWVTVFVLRDVEGHLWVESEDRALEEDTEAVAAAAMEQLFTVEPTDPELFSPPVGSGVEVLGVNIDDDVLTVDVSDAIYDASVGAAGEGMFRMAFLFTGTQFDTVRYAELQVEGEPVDELWGHIDWSERATPDPYALAPIDVERPRYGESWPPGPITVMGTSLTYESEFELELLAPNGEVAERTFTMARQEAVDQRGPFEHTFEVEADQPGDWTIRVIEPDPSGGEGRPPFVAETVVTIE